MKHTLSLLQDQMYQVNRVIDQLERRIMELEKPKFACPMCYRIVDKICVNGADEVDKWGNQRHGEIMYCKHCEKNMPQP